MSRRRLLQDSGVVPLPKISALLPVLFILGCGEEEGIIRLSVRGAFEPAALDFGEVPVQTGKSLQVSLQNVAGAAFEIGQVQVPEGFAIRGVKGDFEGRLMNAGSAMDFEVVFIPMNEGERSEQLVVHIGQEQTVTLDLHGIGTLVRLPLMEVMPAAVNFGVVEIGSQSRATVTLSNEGNAAGNVMSASLESTGAPLMVGDEFLVATPLPLTVAAEGGQQQIELAFSPSSEGPKTDRMLLQLQEDVAPVVIELSGEGRVPFGEIFCEPGRVEFGQVERGLVERREVTCTARGGPARLVGARIEGATDQFFVPNPPNTRDLASDESFAISVEFRPEGLPDGHSGQLLVDFTGANGAGTAEVQLSGEVVPPPPTATAVTVVLSWDTNNTDLDLHLTRPPGRANVFDNLFESSIDCYYANRSPDWNAPGPSDDPFLDDDDIDGYGPETINLEQTQPGSYEVFVHYYSDSFLGPSTPRVEIHLNGQLAGTFDRPSFQCDDIWHVGTIVWDGTNGTFNPSNNVMPDSDEGACF